MDRDIIVVFSNVDCAYVTLNGVQINYSIEHGSEVGAVLCDLFDQLEHSYNKPIIADIYEDDYDFSYGEIQAFWERVNNSTRFFTDSELEVLYVTNDREKFVNEIKKNLQPRAGQIDKEIQEM